MIRLFNIFAIFGLLLSLTTTAFSQDEDMSYEEPAPMPVNTPVPMPSDDEGEDYGGDESYGDE